MSTTYNVEKLYQFVIDDVISHVREAFLDEGIDEQVIVELKQSWEAKLKESKAVEPDVDHLGRDSVLSGPGSGVEGGNPPIQQGVVSGATMPANAMIPVQINVPLAQGGGQRSITVHVPASALQGGASVLQNVLNHPTMTAALTLPPEMASNVLQNHINTSFGLPPVMPTQIRSQQLTTNSGIVQMDGAQDTSDDDDEEDEDDDDGDDQDDNDDQNEDNECDTADVEPLNSDDDIKEEDLGDLFETDNVVVCQYDKITRSRNKWKFHLKDGIMNLKGKDFVFQKASGDAEW